MHSRNPRDKRFGRGKKTRDGLASNKKRHRPKHLVLENIRFRNESDIAVGKLLQKFGYTFRYGSGFEITGKRQPPKCRKLDGVQYCNELERRVAKLLKNNNIKFEYSKKFATINRFGQPNTREVDFWLKEPIQVYWEDKPIQALELKGGHLDDGCWYQKKELKDVGVQTWIVLPEYVEFWERHGFLRKDDLRTRNNTK
ncbi:MAG: hypothetical protein HY226_02400 [Candidatus Vogelbacteria bacterium]|nr:hypothetical protein [Candidatus Vogelbacteria bacterium]